MKKEFFALLRDRWSIKITTLTFSIPTIILIISSISGRPDIVWITLYLFIIYMIGSLSWAILSSKEKLSATDIARSGSTKKLVSKYPKLMSIGRIGVGVSLLLIPIFSFVFPFNQPINILLNGTFTPTPTVTPTPTQTFTLTPSITPTLTPTLRPVSDYLYYMIVLDASESMNESFHGLSKWNVALNTLTEILNGLNRDAKYGLVVIGGSDSSGLGNPCGDPSTAALPFSNRDSAWSYFTGLQPKGGGSFYRAFSLAKTQLEGLSRDTVRTLIFITGVSDICEPEHEWTALENLVAVPDTTIGLFSQIIILDEDGFKSQKLADRFNNVSENVNAQAPQSIEDAHGGATVINVVKNVTNYVNNAISIVAATTPAPPSTFTFTPKPGVTVPGLPIQDNATIPPTFTPTPTFTLTSTSSPSPTFSPTNVPTPFVELRSYSYLQVGTGCQVDITVRVSSSPATGSFHVWNANYGPEGDVYSPTTLQVGEYNNNLVTLGGLSPEFYSHDVWFEYNGVASNRLTNLVCPGLVPAP